MGDKAEQFVDVSLRLQHVDLVPGGDLDDLQIPHHGDDARQVVVDRTQQPPRLVPGRAGAQEWTSSALPSTGAPTS
jgi:hypothetical protein